MCDGLWTMDDSSTAKNTTEKKKISLLVRGGGQEAYGQPPIRSCHSMAVLCYFPCCRAGPVFPQRRGIESPWVRGGVGARGVGDG